MEFFSATNNLNYAWYKNTKIWTTTGTMVPAFPSPEPGGLKPQLATPPRLGRCGDPFEKSEKDMDISRLAIQTYPLVN